MNETKRKMKVKMNKMNIKNYFAVLLASALALCGNAGSARAEIELLTGVEVDPTSTFEPTRIINGGFDTEPWEDFVVEGVRYTKENRFPFESKGHELPIEKLFPNGIDEGWNTTECVTYDDTIFEWATTVNNYWVPKDNTHLPFAELCACNLDVLSQDLTTHGGDVILWTLRHGFRKYVGAQSMRVEIGAPNGAATGVAESANSNIKPETKATYVATGVTNPTGATYGYEGSLGNLSLPSSTACDWYDVSGIYVIPEGQTVTRFAFIPIEPNNGGGNLMDDLTFSTIIGNLKAVANADNSVTITGYWGDENEAKHLCVKIDEVTYNLDMSGIHSQNFIVTIPYAKVGNAMSFNVYHEDYPSVKRTISIQHANQFKIVADGATFRAWCTNELHSVETGCPHHGEANALEMRLDAASVPFTGLPYDGVTLAGETNEWIKTGLPMPTEYSYAARGSLDFVATPPTAEGVYTVKATVRDVYATADFEILSPVPYLVWDPVLKQLTDATCTSYTLVTAEMTELNSGWYVVQGELVIDRSGITDEALYQPGLKVNGDAHLILADGAKLVVTGAENRAGIDVRVSTNESGAMITNSISIYGQYEGTGALKTSGGFCSAGIGCGYELGGSTAGTVVIHGGIVLAEAGGQNAAGIGGGWSEDPEEAINGGTVIINGGMVTAYGGEWDGPGIGGGKNGDAGRITINGGFVHAVGRAGGAGIGGFCGSAGGAVAVNGGTVIAIGSVYTEGIGAGSDNDDPGTFTLGPASVGTILVGMDPTGTDVTEVSAENFRGTAENPGWCTNCYVRIEAVYSPTPAASDWAKLQQALTNDAAASLTCEAFEYNFKDGTNFVKLLKDITVNPDVDICLAIAPNSRTVLDLNGMTLDRGLSDYELEDEESGVTDGEVIKVFGMLTVTDTSANHDGQITGGCGVYCGGVSVGENKTVGAFDDWDFSNAQFVLENGIICNNRTGEDDGGAGGVYVTHGEFVMLGGKIINNIGTEAGGVASDDEGGEPRQGEIAPRAKFDLRGGVIAGNSALIAGGVFSQSYFPEALKIGGNVVITNNTGTMYCGGVAAAGLTIGGSPVIRDNAAAMFGRNLFVISDRKSSTLAQVESATEPLETGADVWVTTFDINDEEPSYAEPICFLKNCTAAAANYFHSEIPDTSIFFRDGALWLGEGVVVEGSPEKPWDIAAPESEEPVTAYTNGTGTVVIEGAGTPKTLNEGEEPWAGAVPAITEIVVPTGRGPEFQEKWPSLANLITDGTVEVTYYAWNKEAKVVDGPYTTNAIPVTAEMTTLESGWYVVMGKVDIVLDPEDDDSRSKPALSVNGDAHLVLMDDVADLTLSGGERAPGLEVSIVEGENDNMVTNSLTIYGQANGTGRLTASGSGDATGIGGARRCACGVITINGGTVSASGSGDNGAGIGGGAKGESGSVVTINGGTVFAQGAEQAPGIGDGGECEGGCVVTINGGTVTANGGDFGAGIGGGMEWCGGTITINGGTVKACGIAGAGIGGGMMSPGGTVTINGGDVTAIGLVYEYEGMTCQGDSIGAGCAYGGKDDAPELSPGTFEMNYPGAKIYTSANTVGLKAEVVSEDEFSSWHSKCYAHITSGTLQQGCPEMAWAVGVNPADSVLAYTNGLGQLVVEGDGLPKTLSEGEEPWGDCEIDGIRVPSLRGDVFKAAWPHLAYLIEDGTIPVEYYAWDGTKVAGPLVTNAIIVTSETTTLRDGLWYVVTDKVDILRDEESEQCGLVVVGSANLILMDDVGELTLQGGEDCAGLSVSVDESYDDDSMITNSLAIYGQAKGTGRLTSRGDYGAGIGGYDYASCGTLSIHGGIIEAVGGSGAAGIGGGTEANGGRVTIYGGVVTARAGSQAAGIGGGFPKGDYAGEGRGGQMLFYGGVVTAIGGGEECDCIGGGRSSLVPGTFQLGPETAAKILVNESETVEGATRVEASGFADWHRSHFVHISAPSATILSAKSMRPGGEWNGKANVGYSLLGLDENKEYELAFTLTVGDKTVEKKIAVDPVADGDSTYEIDSTTYFGEMLQDPAAKLTLTLTEVGDGKVRSERTVTFPFGNYLDLTVPAVGRASYEILQDGVPVEVGKKVSGTYVVSADTPVSVHYTPVSGYRFIRGGDSWSKVYTTEDLKVDEIVLTKDDVFAEIIGVERLPVAMIVTGNGATTNFYYSVQAAFDSEFTADQSVTNTVTLLKDYTETQVLTNMGDIPFTGSTLLGVMTGEGSFEPRTARLDLNGFTLTGGCSEDISSQTHENKTGPAILVLPSSVLIIDDSSAEKTGQIRKPIPSAALLAEKHNVSASASPWNSVSTYQIILPVVSILQGDFTLAGGTICGQAIRIDEDKGVVGIFNMGRFSMTGGTIRDCSVADAVVACGIYSMHGATFIFDGKVKDAIMAESGTMSISGGLFGKDDVKNNPDWIVEGAVCAANTDQATLAEGYNWRVSTPTAAEGSPEKPWDIAAPESEEPVTAYTNGTGTVVIEGAGTPKTLNEGEEPWAGAVPPITEIVVPTGRVDEFVEKWPWLAKLFTDGTTQLIDATEFTVTRNADGTFLVRPVDPISGSEWLLATFSAEMANKVVSEGNPALTQSESEMVTLGQLIGLDRRADEAEVAIADIELKGAVVTCPATPENGCFTLPEGTEFVVLMRVNTISDNLCRMTSVGGVKGLSQLISGEAIANQAGLPVLVASGCEVTGCNKAEGRVNVRLAALGDAAAAAPFDCSVVFHLTAGTAMRREVRAYDAVFAAGESSLCEGNVTLDFPEVKGAGDAPVTVTVRIEGRLPTPASVEAKLFGDTEEAAAAAIKAWLADPNAETFDKWVESAFATNETLEVGSDAMLRFNKDLAHVLAALVKSALVYDNPELHNPPCVDMVKCNLRSDVIFRLLARMMDDNGLRLGTAVACLGGICEELSKAEEDGGFYLAELRSSIKNGTLPKGLRELLDRYYKMVGYGDAERAAALRLYDAWLKNPANDEWNLEKLFKGDLYGMTYEEIVAKAETATAEDVYSAINSAFCTIWLTFDSVASCGNREALQSVLESEHCFCALADMIEVLQVGRAEDVLPTFSFMWQIFSEELEKCFEGATDLVAKQFARLRAAERDRLRLQTRMDAVGAWLADPKANTAEGCIDSVVAKLDAAAASGDAAVMKRTCLDVAQVTRALTDRVMSLESFDRFRMVFDRGYLKLPLQIAAESENGAAGCTAVRDLIVPFLKDLEEDYVALRAGVVPGESISIRERLANLYAQNGELTQDERDTLLEQFDNWICDTSLDNQLPECLTIKDEELDFLKLFEDGGTLSVFNLCNRKIVSLWMVVDSLIGCGKAEDAQTLMGDYYVGSDLLDLLESILNNDGIKCLAISAKMYEEVKGFFEDNDLEWNDALSAQYATLRRAEREQKVSGGAAAECVGSLFTPALAAEVAALNGETADNVRFAISAWLADTSIDTDGPDAWIRGLQEVPNFDMTKPNDRRQALDILYVLAGIPDVLRQSGDTVVIANFDKDEYGFFTEFFGALAQDWNDNPTMPIKKLMTKISAAIYEDCLFASIYAAHSEITDHAKLFAAVRQMMRTHAAAQVRLSGEPPVITKLTGSYVGMNGAESWKVCFVAPDYVGRTNVKQVWFAYDADEAGDAATKWTELEAKIGEDVGTFALDEILASRPAGCKDEQFFANLWAKGVSHAVSPDIKDKAMVFFAITHEEAGKGYVVDALGGIRDMEKCREMAALPPAVIAAVPPAVISQLGEVLIQKQGFTAYHKPEGGYTLTVDGELEDGEKWAAMYFDATRSAMAAQPLLWPMMEFYLGQAVVDNIAVDPIKNYGTFVELTGATCEIPDTAVTVFVAKTHQGSGKYVTESQDYVIDTMGGFLDLRTIPVGETGGNQMGESEGSKYVPWKVGPDGSDLPQAYTNGNGGLVIEGEGTVEKKPWLDDKDGITEIVIKDPEVELPEDAFAGMGSDDEKIKIVLPDNWQGELPDEDGNWYGAKAEIETWPFMIRNVRFQQRYPWNGMVDIFADVYGPETNDVNVYVSAFNGEIRIPASAFEPDTLTVDLTNGVTQAHFGWDAVSDLGESFRSTDVSVTVALHGDDSEPHALPAIAERRIWEGNQQFTSWLKDANVEVPQGDKQGWSKVEPGSRLSIYYELIGKDTVDAKLCVYTLVEKFLPSLMSTYNPAEGITLESGSTVFRMNLTKEDLDAIVKDGGLAVNGAHIAVKEIWLRDPMPDDPIQPEGLQVSSASEAGRIDLRYPLIVAAGSVDEITYSANVWSDVDHGDLANIRFCRIYSEEIPEVSTVPTVFENLEGTGVKEFTYPERAGLYAFFHETVPPPNANKGVKAPLFAPVYVVWYIGADDHPESVYAIDYGNGEIVIMGNGRMKDFAACGPWGTDITGVTIESGVWNVGANAFKGCTKMTHAELPESMKVIGDGAFAGATGLRTIRNEAWYPPTFDGDPFTDVVKENVIVYVPDEVYYDYVYSDDWSQFWLKYKGDYDMLRLAAEIYPGVEFTVTVGRIDAEPTVYNSTDYTDYFEADIPYGEMVTLTARITDGVSVFDNCSTEKTIVWNFYSYEDYVSEEIAPHGSDWATLQNALAGTPPEELRGALAYENEDGTNVVRLLRDIVTQTQFDRTLVVTGAAVLDLAGHDIVYSNGLRSVISVGIGGHSGRVPAVKQGEALQSRSFVETAAVPGWLRVVDTSAEGDGRIAKVRYELRPAEEEARAEEGEAQPALKAVSLQSGLSLSSASCGIAVNTGSTFVMEGGVLTNCYGLDAGGVYNEGTVVLEGGAIAGNAVELEPVKAVASGSDVAQSADAVRGSARDGIVNAYGGTLVITGGKVKDGIYNFDDNRSPAQQQIAVLDDEFAGQQAYVASGVSISGGFFGTEDVMMHPEWVAEDHLCIENDDEATIAEGYGWRVVTNVKGSKWNPWDVGAGDDPGAVKAYTNGNQLVIRGEGDVKDKPLPWDDFIDSIPEIVIEDGVTGLPDDAFTGGGTEDDPMVIELPDLWPGEMPGPNGEWYGGYARFADGHYPLVVRNIRFQQRYPWNNLVDIDFDLYGSTNSVTLDIVAKCGSKVFDVRTLVGGESGFTYADVEGRASHHVVWDAGADILDARRRKFRCDDSDIYIGPQGTVSVGGSVIKEIDDYYVYEADGDGGDLNSIFAFQLTSEDFADFRVGDRMVLTVYNNGKPENSQQVGFYPNGGIHTSDTEGALYFRRDFPEGLSDTIVEFTQEMKNLLDRQGYFYCTCTWQSLRAKSIAKSGKSGKTAFSEVPGPLNLVTGARWAREREGILADPAWADGAALTLGWLNGEETVEVAEATNATWIAGRYGEGTYRFTLTGTALDYAVTFFIPKDGQTVLADELLTSDVTIDSGTVRVYGETVIASGATLTIAEGVEVTFDPGSGFRVEEGGHIFAPGYDVSVDPDTGLVTLTERPRPVISNIRFSQRYPWNGLVDIYADVAYAADPSTGVWVRIEAEMISGQGQQSAEKKAVKETAKSGSKVKEESELIGKIDYEEEKSARSTAIKAKTLYLAADPSVTNDQFKVAQGPVHLVWDAKADLPAETCGDFNITVLAALDKMVVSASGGYGCLCFTAVPHPSGRESSEGLVVRLARQFIEQVANKEAAAEGDAVEQQVNAQALEKEREKEPLVSDDVNIQISWDGKNWEDYVIGKYVTVPFGSKIYWRGDNPKGLTTESTTYTFETQGGAFEASGSVMSLIDPTCTATAIPSAYCFGRLFVRCNGILTAPELPATELTPFCYCQMFQTALFLQTAPVLPAAVVPNSAYARMFFGCTKLNEVTMNATTLMKMATDNWLSHTAQTGTLYLNRALDGVIEVDSPSGIPEGWSAVYSGTPVKPRTDIIIEDR